MGSKNITIKEEAYESLKAHKRADESFSDVVLRLSGADKNVMKGFGILSDEEAAKLQRAREEHRERFDRDLREGRDELFGQ